MNLATSLQSQLAHDPWPASAEKVIFLLDTTRRFERQLLENWIALHANQSIGHTIVLLDLRDDRKTLDIAALSETLKQHPNATVAPLRVSWIQPERSASSGPRLRDVLRGGERRPPGWLAIVSRDSIPSGYTLRLASRGQTVISPSVLRQDRIV